MRTTYLFYPLNSFKRYITTLDKADLIFSNIIIFSNITLKNSEKGLVK